MVRFPTPNFTFIGATCSPCGAKRKNHFGPLNKNNTGMAALRAGLPVIKYGENDFKYGGWNFLHPAMWHDHEIDFVR